MTRDSEIIESHKNCPKVQDAYTLRCMPQVFGAVRDVIKYAEKVISIEMNSATDNPLIFGEESISGGNFHGEPLAFAMDFLSIAICELGNFSERRIARLVDSHLSGLPPFLTKESGINSGFMIPQYVAASLASENKALCYPASVDSLPTSANQEDHQSMGSIAGYKLLNIIENSQKIIAIELLTAAQALEFHDLEPSPAAKSARDRIRKEVPPIEEDRAMSEDIEKILKLVKDGEIVRAVEETIGEIE
jgi:histidine ammonia-lyase